MRPLVVEALVNTETAKIWWRWDCSLCKARGPVHPTLHEAERDAAKHNREAHADTAVRA